MVLINENCICYIDEGTKIILQRYERCRKSYYRGTKIILYPILIVKLAGDLAQLLAYFVLYDTLIGRLEKSCTISNMRISLSHIKEQRIKISTKGNYRPKHPHPRELRDQIISSIFRALWAYCVFSFFKIGVRLQTFRHRSCY